MFGLFLSQFLSLRIIIDIFVFIVLLFIDPFQIVFLLLFDLLLSTILNFFEIVGELNVSELFHVVLILAEVRQALLRWACKDDHCLPVDEG